MSSSSLTLPLSFSEPVMRQCGRRSSPLWAAWKIHQAFPLESVWIRGQALQQPHTWHFYHLRLNSANVMFRKQQITADAPRLTAARFRPAHLQGQSVHANSQGSQVPTDKTRWTIPFSFEFFTLIVRVLTFTVSKCEQLAGSGVTPRGRMDHTALSTLERTVHPGR